jgi:hypothetical protein
MSRRRRAAAVAATAVLGVLGTGCADDLPDEGPVVTADLPSRVEDRAPSDINVTPPPDDASPLEIARGFLDAMTASPIRLDVAREYLTQRAATQWDPAASTITYADSLPPRVEGQDVIVQLSDAQLIGRSGDRRGQLPAAEETLRFSMELQDGQYRIANPRDALVVPTSWFAQRFRQVSLYFFDPSGSVLVPEPVFVPIGEQLASTLISGLLEGPGDDLDGVARTYLPGGLSVGLSVPVSSSGVAAVDLGGQATPDPAQVERLFAQVAWTLRQEPTISAVSITVGGTTLRAPSGGTEYPLEDAVRYDPTGFEAPTRIFGLARGRLGVADGTELQPLGGPFSTGRVALRHVSVDLSGDRAAGTTPSGELLLAATDGKGIAELATGLESPLRPAWDATGRVWVVDRRSDGAVVGYAQPGRRPRLRQVQVDGVSGLDVVSFLVSRDGTRFVAVVREQARDEVVVGRIRVAADGRVLGVVDLLRLADDDLDPPRIRDIAWSSPTTVAILSPVSDDLSEVRTVGVDGADPASGALSTSVGDATGLTGTPQSGQPPYAVTPTGLVDLTTGVTLTFGSDVRELSYVG